MVYFDIAFFNHSSTGPSSFSFNQRDIPGQIDPTKDLGVGRGLALDQSPIFFPFNNNELQNPFS